MSLLDWIVLLGTLAFIAIYGIVKNRGIKNIEGYLKGDQDMRWYTIGLSVMATQASAVTFLSTPGKAFDDGLGFVQFYFGLPLAMVILCTTFLPIFYKLNVYTAYEFLEKRFNLETRLLAAFLFLLNRGLSAGITIYAPAIILSSILGWSLNVTNVFIGLFVIIYTVSGGTKAVSQTQKQQMLVILIGMVVAFGYVLYLLPEKVGFMEAMHVAGAMQKLNAVDFSFDFNSRYTFWSGITGGLFLSLSYFGTDQSQVQRYLSGKSLKEGRLGLLFNGILKIPMQFLILLTGVMVFVFFQFEKPPVFFNETEINNLSQNADFLHRYQGLENEYSANFDRKKETVSDYVDAVHANDKATQESLQATMMQLNEKNQHIRKQTKELIQEANPKAETSDSDYVFITFVMTYLPAGLVGLLIAVIFCAAMSSTSSELNALASSTLVDFYKRVYRQNADEKHYVFMSKLFTALWGVLAIAFALFASLVENLIEAVNIIGSLFYGTILGMFLAAFYMKFVKGRSVLWAAIISEIIVIILYFTSDIGFLWFNAIGCLGVMALSAVLHVFYSDNSTDSVG